MAVLKQVEVDAVEDRSRAEGGHAVILLRGIERQPANVQFTLQPVLADSRPEAADAGRWPDITPIEARLTVDGLALTVGPDVTEKPELLPGVAVSIELEGAGVRGEFLWPAIAAVTRPKRRNIMLRANPPPGPAKPSSIEPPKSAFAQSTQAPDGGDLRQSETVRSEEDNSAPAVPAAQEGERAHRRTVVLSSSLPRNEQRTDGSQTAVIRSSQQDVAPSTVPADDVSAVGAPPRAARTADREPVAFEGETTPPAEPSARVQIRRLTPKTAAACAVVALLGLQWLSMRALDLGIVKRSLMAPRQVAATAAPSSSPSHISIYDVISAGARSPRGFSADGVSPARALQTAHALLHGPDRDRDPEEGIYWLKRYLASTAGTDHARIALSQLGSAYIIPVKGRPDYESARLAWELASALGDPVAMCFLGAMYERGLGVEPSSERAVIWFERAAALGRRCADASVTSDPMKN